MTIHLPKELESSLQAAVDQGEFASLDEAIAKAAALLLERIQQRASAPPTTEEAAAPGHKPIWEVIDEENQALPPNVWDALPDDLSEQHDHYIYGTPKRPSSP